MNLWEPEMYQIKNVIGVDPTFYEYLFTADMFLYQLCSFCCFSMRFINVMMNLVSTLIQPVTVAYVSALR